MPYQAQYIKTSAEVIHLKHNFAPWLGTETIASAAIASSTLGTISVVTWAGAVLTYAVDGGQNGEDGTATLQITSSGGQIFEDSIRIRIQDN